MASQGSPTKRLQDLADSVFGALFRDELTPPEVDARLYAFLLTIRSEVRRLGRKPGRILASERLAERIDSWMNEFEQVARAVQSPVQGAGSKIPALQGELCGEIKILRASVVYARTLRAASLLIRRIALCSVDEEAPGLLSNLLSIQADLQTRECPQVFAKAKGGLDAFVAIVRARHAYVEQA